MIRKAFTALVACTVFCAFIEAAAGETGVRAAEIVVPTPSPMPVPSLSPDDYAKFANMPLAELCGNASNSTRQDQAIDLLGMRKRCTDLHVNMYGLLSLGAYGYQHPAATACNAGNGMRTGLLAFITGKSIGNANLITGIGTLLGVIFAGCNNQPPPATPVSVSSPPAVAGIQAPSAASVIVGANAKETTLAVMEPKYSGSFTITSQSPVVVDIVTASPVSPSSPGSFAPFAIKADAKAQVGQTGTILVLDQNGNSATITVTGVSQ